MQRSSTHFLETQICWTHTFHWLPWGRAVLMEEWAEIPVQGLYKCKKLENHRWALRSKTVRKEGWKEKATEEQGRSVCLMTGVKSAGGEVRRLLKVRDHEGNRQLNQAGQLATSTKTWECSGQQTPVHGAHWCCASVPVRHLAWLLLSSLEQHAGRELQHMPNLYAQKTFIILPIKHPRVCYVQ